MRLIIKILFTVVISLFTTSCLALFYPHKDHDGYKVFRMPRKCKECGHRFNVTDSIIVCPPAFVDSLPEVGLIPAGFVLSCGDMTRDSERFIPFVGKVDLGSYNSKWICPQCGTKYHRGF